DGSSNLLEYALGTHPLDHTAKPAPFSDVEEFTVASSTARYFTFSFERRTDASDLLFYVEFAEGLTLPWLSNGVLVRTTPGPGNTVTEVWRAPLPLAENTHHFARVRVVRP